MQSTEQDPVPSVPTDVAYDARKIHDCCRRLYARASEATRAAAAAGVVFGLGVGFALGIFTDNAQVLVFGPLAGAVLGGVLGNESGKNRAMMLKLTAQNALCNLQIAINTAKRSERAE